MSPPSSDWKESTALEAARHICQESRVVLTSLRGGPPAVARGELAQDLMDVRVIVKANLPVSSSPPLPSTASADETTDPALERPSTPGMIDEEGPDGAVIVQRPEPSRQPETPRGSVQAAAHDDYELPPDDVGHYARPFLAVVMDPRAAGPHTLVALRALFRLLESGSLIQHTGHTHRFIVHLEPLMRGVLACKFEQTDAGADEAVEMAIADLLALLVKLDNRAFLPETLMEAFNTVFVTRNTFVHSPALCYHFEDVLTTMVVSVFHGLDTEPVDHRAARLILEFLVNQLLHTPLTGGDALDEPGREAQLAHDATRVLCLKLTRCCLRVGWARDAAATRVGKSGEVDKRDLLQIIEDDLCLSLLMTGQAVWAYSPGFISIEVLSEICETLSTLWNTLPLREHLLSQFETIFTGFYQRALVLLQKRSIPMDSSSFNENLVFDAEIEVILESLVDLLSMQESYGGQHDRSMIETLFSTYDCHINRSDVTEHLLIELCRCCGAVIDEDGVATLDPSGVVAVPEPETQEEQQQVEETSRPVPPHLKELCAESLLSGMKRLFEETDLSEEMVEARAKRRESFMGSIRKGSMKAPPELDLVSIGENMTVLEGGDTCRSIKSKKRLMRKAAKLFNVKATKGINFMVKSGLVPEPVKPESVASFLRHGLVLGLEKAAVGQYLGELGKAPVAGKSPPSWERDWFHKDVLSTYCSLFRFEGQSLLDGLRMFLAAFRLPGEGQQIDRIVQAFADSCGQRCDEATRLKLFSDDPKRAGDAAFLLAYSIIMLNTDLHNPRIREDKKMTLQGFLRNNTDYGRDITEKGKEFPADFLTGIYESIREEEIRTEKEGAEGHMTVERWKDVLRGPPAESGYTDLDQRLSPDPDDLRELIVECAWQPVLSANGVLWGVFQRRDASFDDAKLSGMDLSQSGMLSAQGARLGMDLALEMLSGVCNLGRIDVFRQIFWWVCRYTGLLGSYNTDAVDRTSVFINSVEAQSAVIVAVQTAHDAADEIGENGWKQVWGILFELRDLRLLGGGRRSKVRSILLESDRDLLSAESRREWTMRLMKGDGSYNAEGNRLAGASRPSFFGAMGRALFGSDPAADDDPRSRSFDEDDMLSPHGKEELTVWDDLAPSDDEDEIVEEEQSDGTVDFNASVKEHAMLNRFASAGANFENQLVHEDMLIHNHATTPVTGLERVEETLSHQISPRARVRKRLVRACDFAGLLSESRFMELSGIKTVLAALVDLIDGASTEKPELDAEDGDSANPISPASEAMAEVLLCEIALKNKDRLRALWEPLLKEHYTRRLTVVKNTASDQSAITAIDPGTEKCVTGLLRLCACAVPREELADEVVSSLALLGSAGHRKDIQALEKHIGEGLWRLCCNVDGLRQLGPHGWDGILRLTEMCASRGGRAVSRKESMTGRSAGLPEDDPALQAYRSIHLLLHSPELRDAVPFTITQAIRRMISTGEKGNCPKLCLAGLDMLHELHTRLGNLITHEDQDEDESDDLRTKKELWIGCWVKVLEGMADVAEHSADAVSVLTCQECSDETHQCLFPGDSTARIVCPYGHVYGQAWLGFAPRCHLQGSPASLHSVGWKTNPHPASRRKQDGKRNGRDHD